MQDVFFTLWEQLMDFGSRVKLRPCDLVALVAAAFIIGGSPTAAHVIPGDAQAAARAAYKHMSMAYGCGIAMGTNEYGRARLRAENLLRALGLDTASAVEEAARWEDAIAASVKPRSTMEFTTCSSDLARTSAEASNAALRMRHPD